MNNLFSFMFKKLNGTNYQTLALFNFRQKVGEIRRNGSVSPASYLTLPAHASLKAASWIVTQVVVT